jgi:hypothetical protein
VVARRIAPRVEKAGCDAQLSRRQGKLRHLLAYDLHDMAISARRSISLARRRAVS